jgi:hypothetical protein
MYCSAGGIESAPGSLFFLCFEPGLSCGMPERVDLTPATPEDLAEALAFALRYSGRKRTHHAGEMMAAIVAKRLVEHLERSGFVVMKKPPIGGGAAIGRGHDGR